MVGKDDPTTSGGGPSTNELMMMIMQQQKEQRKLDEERIERQRKLDEERDKRMLDMFTQMLNSARASSVAPSGDVSFSSGQSKTATLDAIEKQIRTFVYEPEEGITFDSWFMRNEEIFEQDLKDVEDGEKTRILLRHVSDKVDKQYRDHVLPKKPADLTFDRTLKQMEELFGKKKSAF